MPAQEISSRNDGLVCAYVLDGNGGATPIGWDEIAGWSPERGTAWIHFDRGSDRVGQWLRTESGLNPIVAESLLAADIRPRVVPSDANLLVNLRGVNLNPGADPEDMVGLRIWIEEHRIITVRHRHLAAIGDLREALAQNKGPSDRGTFLVQLTDRMIDRMGPVIDGIDDQVDHLEEQVLTSQSATLRATLADLRREVIGLRRYLAPQRDAMSRLATEPLDWLSDMDKARLREIADRTVRYVEELDAARERAAVVQEELTSRLSEQMNKTMYVLTVIAGILLPPSLITGLLGVNVGGIPGIESDYGFAILVAAIIALVAFEYALFRRLKWI